MCAALAAISTGAFAQSSKLTFPRTPLAFERNVGQTGGGTQYLARYGGGLVFLRGDRATISRQGASMTVRFAGGRPQAQAVAGATLPGRVNYIKGSDPSRWITGLSTHKRVRFREVYPGIDVVYYGARGGTGAHAGPDVLEFDCEVRPGADPARIQLAFDGADSVRIENGDLVARRKGLEIRLRKPVTYQMAGASRVPVASKWTLKGGTASATPRAAFRIAKYDRSRTLVVDPVLFLYSTRFGGSNVDRFHAVAEVPNEDMWPIVTVGETLSADYPVTWPPTGYNDNTDAVVTVWSSNLEYPVVSTYMGGSGEDTATCAAIDAMANVFVAGTTSSTDFPTRNASQSSNAGGKDGFVVRLTGWRSSVEYSTYYGGSGDDSIAGLLNESTSVIVAGSTSSNDLPNSTGYSPDYFGGSDGFLALFTPDGQLVRTSYFGGPSDEYVTGISRSDTHVLIGGYGGDGVPMVGFPYQDLWAGGTDGFVAGFTPDLLGLVYSTYLGGSGDDRILAVTSTEYGILVTGETSSTDFPTSPDAYQSDLKGTSDAFVARFQNGVEDVDLSTYLGGTGADAGTSVTQSLAVSERDGAFVIVAGHTTSVDFPIEEAFQPTNAGGSDGFIARLTPDQGVPVQSSYLGGSGDDIVTGMSVDLWGAVLVVGSTASPDYPSQRPPIYGNTGSGVDGFMTLLAYEYLGTGGWLMYASGRPGQTITFEGGISGPKIPIEGGIVHFSVAGVPVGWAQTNYYGNAYLMYTIPTGMAPGTYSLKMEFHGNMYYTPAELEAPFEVIGARATLLYVPPRTTTNGRLAYLRGFLYERVSRAWVAGETLEFRVDGTSVGSAVTNASGMATLSYLGPYAEGTWPLVVSFAGTSTYQPSSGSSTITINKGSLYLWAYGRSNWPGATTRLHCLVRSVPDRVPVGGRQIRFSVNGTFVGDGTSDASGWAEALWAIPSGTASGTYPISVEFTGDSAYHPATGAGTVRVLP